MTTDTHTKHTILQAELNETSVKSENENNDNDVEQAPSVDASDKKEASSRERNRRQPRRARRVTRERVRPEFDQKIISVRRVTRVMAGGRRFSFSVAMVAGDGRGRVGVGTGKAADTALAVEKALRACKKNMITVPRTEENSIPHEVRSKYASSIVAIRPVPNRGLVAGSSVRTVLELAGVTDVTAKILSRSKNRLNNAQATIESLKKLKRK